MVLCLNALLCMFVCWFIPGRISSGLRCYICLGIKSYWILVALSNISVNLESIMENIYRKYQSVYKVTRNQWCLLTAYGECLQHERDISGGQSLSGNMVSSDCWGMSTLLILCKPVWGMICSAAQHPFLMENSPSSQSIYGSWKGHVEQGDSMVCPCAAQPQRWQDLNEVIRMISGAPKILCEHLKLFVLCI